MTTNDASTAVPLGAVLGFGAACSIGLGVRPIRAAMLAGLSGFEESTLADADGEPARSARVPILDERAPRPERLAFLCRIALSDLRANLPLDTRVDVPVFAGVASDSPGADRQVIRDALADTWLEGSDARDDRVRIASGGRVAFAVALAKALAHLADRRHDLALVIGVDSECTEAALDRRIASRRLLTSRGDGSLPGEASVAMVVAAPHAASGASRSLVAGPAFGQDDPDVLLNAPQGAVGLGRAFAALREGTPSGARPVDRIVSFGSGESGGVRAFTTAYLRNAELMPEPLTHESVAANVGDCGAASAGIALLHAQAISDLHDGEQRALLYGHADDGRCAAAMLITPSARGERDG